MALRLSYCGQCARFRPEIKRTIAKLKQEYPNDLHVVELECMVACDDGPVAMIEYELLTHVTPDDLYQRVTSRLSP